MHGGLLARMDVGVAIFFVLSGFLLYRPWACATLAGRTPRARRYLWRRAVRILPAYWVALVVVLLTVADASPADAVRHLTLTQLYGGDAARRVHPDLEPRHRGVVLPGPPAAGGRGGDGARPSPGSWPCSRAWPPWRRCGPRSRQRATCPIWRTPGCRLTWTGSPPGWPSRSCWPTWRPAPAVGRPASPSSSVANRDRCWPLAAALMWFASTAAGRTPDAQRPERRRERRQGAALRRRGDRRRHGGCSGPTRDRDGADPRQQAGGVSRPGVVRRLPLAPGRAARDLRALRARGVPGVLRARRRRHRRGYRRGGLDLMDGARASAAPACSSPVSSDPSRTADPPVRV